MKGAIETNVFLRSVNADHRCEYTLTSGQWLIQDGRGGGRQPLSLGQKPLLPPANKVCEGYVFTGVCLYTGGRSLGLCPGGLSLRPGGGLCQGGLCLGGVCLEGVSVQGGLSRRPPMVMSGQYASYWNAFLFDKTFAKNCMKRKEIGLGWGWLGGVWYGAANAYRRADKRTILIAIRQQLPIRRQSSHNAINHCV